MGNRISAYLLALAIFVVDQISKYWVLGPLRLEQVREIVILPIFSLTYVRNMGISLGLLTADTEAMRWLLVAGTSAVAVGVAWWISREEQRGDRFALALVLGGALGNILDRSRLGYVVDFADLHFGTFRPFLVFNVADAAISIGVVILLYRALFVRQPAPSESQTHA